jgi:hypothetical protein
MSSPLAVLRSRERSYTRSCGTNDNDVSTPVEKRPMTRRHRVSFQPSPTSTVENKATRAGALTGPAFDPRRRWCQERWHSGRPLRRWPRFSVALTLEFERRRQASLLSQSGAVQTTQRHTPVAVQNLTSVVRVAVGAGFACALTTVGAVKCRGFNGNGELPSPSTPSYLRTRQLSGCDRTLDVPG